MIAILHNLIQKIETGGTLSNSLCEASIILITNPGKALQERKTKTIFKNISANGIQQCIK